MALWIFITMAVIVNSIRNHIEKGQMRKAIIELIWVILGLLTIVYGSYIK